jgi:hypothetical protein
VVAKGGDVVEVRLIDKDISAENSVVFLRYFIIFETVIYITPLLKYCCGILQYVIARKYKN